MGVLWAVAMLTIGSLFSGIGGLELGLERAGLGPVLFQVESSEFCRGVLAAHWPKVQRFDDVRLFPALIRQRRQRHRGPWCDELAPDILCGGFPCTDISNAGKRKGIEGHESGLWREMVRTVRLLRPRFVVVENVAALLARGMSDVLGALAAIGYDAEWDCIPASTVGAPHQRDRIFILAWNLSNTERDGGRLKPEWYLRHQAERWDANVAHVRETLAYGDERGREGERLAGGQSKDEGSRGNVFDRCGSEAAWPPGPADMLAWRRVPALAQPALCRLADGLPLDLVRTRKEALRAYGNAVVPAVAEVVGRRLIEIAQGLPSTKALTASAMRRGTSP